MPPTREQLLTSRLAELVDVWLYVRCPAPCTKTAYLPVKTLAKGRADALLSAVVAKLRCKDCVRSPVEVRAVDYPIEAEARVDGPRVSSWMVSLSGFP